MGTTSAQAYQELIALSKKASTLTSISYLLGWDQETYMPDAGAKARAEQSSLMAEFIHDAQTAPRIGELIAMCEQDAELVSDQDTITAANIREFRRDYDLATKLPKELVAELAMVGSEAQHIWKEARQKSDFTLFLPSLEKMVQLSRSKAECYGWADDGEIYDALINEYEPATTSSQIQAIFAPLRDELSSFIKQVQADGTPPDTSILDASIPPDAQHRFGLFVINQLGFDLSAGRLDTTTHPFCEGLAPGDTRMTTRYHEERFTDALYGTMHECGHGLYEQGLPKEHFGQPISESISLGIHESQSRMWENLVGRSEAFWTWALPHAQKILGGALKNTDVKTLTNAVNTVSPSFIRVEADESTYNLHIMIRFGIERALISGELACADMPGVWNQQYQELLGVQVPDDRRGCLQDVHWSFGLFGYFPTYCLGNLYASQLWETINQQIPALNDQMATGDFSSLKQWLNQNIHAHGKRYHAGELCEKLTGQSLSSAPLLRHLRSRIAPVYGL